MPNIQLPVPKELRGQSNWCWAAVAVSVERYYNQTATRTQCQLVDEELHPPVPCSPAGASATCNRRLLGPNAPQSPCCLAGAAPQSNRVWDLDPALARVGHFSSPKTGVLSFAACDAQISTFGRPIGVRIEWTGTQIGHFILITGVGDTSDEMLYIWDPWLKDQHFPHDEVAGSYCGIGTWTDSYLTL